MHRLSLLLSLLVLATPSLAGADDIGADPNDAGKVTAIRKGVK